MKWKAGFSRLCWWCLLGESKDLKRAVWLSRVEKTQKLAQICKSPFIIDIPLPLISLSHFKFMLTFEAGGKMKFKFRLLIFYDATADERYRSIMLILSTVLRRLKQQPLVLTKNRRKIVWIAALVGTFPKLILTNSCCCATSRANLPILRSFVDFANFPPSCADINSEQMCRTLQRGKP